MNKKGFTLIELLAVIVILAIIALIATPIILNVIDTARKGAAKDSAYSYISAVEQYEAQAVIKGEKELKPNIKYNCTQLTIDSEDTALALNDYVLIKGYMPTGSKDYIMLNNRKIVEEGQLTINGYLIIIKDKKIISVEKGEYVDIETLGLNFTNQTMEKGSTFKLVPVFTPKNASDQRVTYESSDESIIRVTEEGEVTALKNGTAKVTVTSKDNTSKKEECNITVITSATGLTLNKTSETIVIGNTVQLTGTIEPGDVTTNALTWTSSDNSIAVVDTNGLVTGLGAGTVTITAKTHNGIEATATITVNVVATGITVSPTSANLPNGDTKELTATVTPSNASNKTVTWTSSNASVATVSSSGVVTAKAVGTATITAKTHNGKTATSTITVVGPTKVAAQSGQTHKGIVYLDPTNLNKYCTASNSVSTTGTKTGCMKWYVIKDNGSSVDMLLDHNTTAKVAYETSGTYKEYAQASIKTQVDSDTTGWASELNPRLITANEVATITGNTTFNGSSSAYFYFGSNNTTYYSPQTEEQKAQQRSFAWLFDYTYNCTNYGCNTADSSTYGYWTSSPVSGNSNYAWYVYDYGGLSSNNVVSVSLYGVRPVITLLKSQLSV